MFTIICNFKKAKEGGYKKAKDSLRIIDIDERKRVRHGRFQK